MDNMIVCPTCGAQLPAGTKHCTECGAKLVSPEAGAAVAFETADHAAAQAEEAVSEAEAVFGAPFAQQPPSVLLNDMAAAEEPISQEKPEPAYPSPKPAPSPYAAPAYQAPAAQAAQAAPAAAPAYQAPAAAPAAAAVPVYPSPAAYPSQGAPAEDPDRPDKKSKYAPMSSLGMALELFLMSIPVVGFVLMILWSCGVCRKIARRNLARAYLILLIVALVIAVVLAILGRFVFQDQLTQIVEQLMPGYTIQWN